MKSRLFVVALVLAPLLAQAQAPKSARAGQAARAPLAHADLKHPGRRVGSCGPSGPRASWEQMLEKLDPALGKAQTDALDDHAANVDLSPKDRALILVGLDALVEAQDEYSHCDVNTAYDLGASTLQMAEVILVAGSFEGNHVVQNGFTALQAVGEERRKAGKKVVDKTGVAPAANKNASPLVLTPYSWIFRRYLGDTYGGGGGGGGNRELEYKTREMMVVAIDAAVSWPEAYFSDHINNAFDNGATVQELLEVIMLAGDVKGYHATRSGTEVFDRVLRDRILRGHEPPYRHSQPKAPPETPGYPALRSGGR